MSTPDAAGLVVGEVVASSTLRFTRETLVRYAGASGDFNPIHYSGHFAAEVGLPGVIAHGLLTMGSALRVVTDWVGDPTRVRSYFVRFTRPVVVPDTEDGVELVVTATVTGVEATVVTLSVEAVCAGTAVLGAARAEVELGDPT